MYCGKRNKKSVFHIDTFINSLLHFFFKFRANGQVKGATVALCQSYTENMTF